MKKNFDLFDMTVEGTKSSCSSELNTADTKDTQYIYNPIAEQREAERQQREVYTAHQDAIRKAGQLTNDITKGIQLGQDPLKLLLKAIECISLMTGDDLFYKLNKDNIKSIYGVGLLEPVPLRLELGEIEGRIVKLNNAFSNATNNDDKTRIERTIKAHEERAEYIRGLLEKQD